MADDDSNINNTSPSADSEEDLDNNQSTDEDQGQESDQEQQQNQQQPQRRESRRINRRPKPKKKKPDQQPQSKQKIGPEKPSSIPKPTPKAGGGAATEKAAEGVGKMAKRTTQQVGQTAKTTGQVAQNVASEAAQTARIAAEATARAAQVVAQTAQTAVQTAIQVAQVTAQLAAQAAAAVAEGVTAAVTFLVSNPVGWAILLIILVFVVLAGVFTCGLNGTLSEAGGSAKSEMVASSTEVSRNPDGTVVQVNNELIARVQSEINDGKLVIYPAGQADAISWDCGISGGCLNILDARLLKTIDYLASLHEYLEIGLLKTNSPSRSVYTLLKYLAEYSSDGTIQTEAMSSKTAFAEGQAMAIVAVDKSKIEEPGVLGQPISMSWQRTLAEAETRPVWEEVAYDVGVLDKNIPKHRVFTQGKSQDDILQVITTSADNKTAYIKIFQLINRIKDLIEQGKAIANLDPQAVNYFSSALAEFSNLVAVVGDDPTSLSDNDLAGIIAQLGQSSEIDSLRNGIRMVYKATQVANMVGWNKPIASGGSLELLKAYEARNKIRLVTKELLEMPTKVALSGNPSVFDADMVAKQIIIYSPEDDLDNGLERIDIFPSGITSVGVGGVGFNDSMKDGVSNYADEHFSHAPIDNGVFSKLGTNFIYTSDDLGGADISTFAFTNDNGGKIYQTAIAGQLLNLWNILVGGAGSIDSAAELAKQATYRDFIQVGF